MTVRILTEQQWEQVWDALGVARGFCLPDADEAVIDAAIDIMRSLEPVEPDCEKCKYVNSPASQDPCNHCMDSSDFHSFEAYSPFCTKCGSTAPPAPQPLYAPKGDTS